MFLVSYDIQDDRLRLKAAKVLIQYGLYRIQYSVFMGTLAEPTESKVFEAMQVLVADTAWTVQDSILVLPLHQYSRDHLQILGQLPEDWDLIQQNLHTLIF